MPPAADDSIVLQARELAAHRLNGEAEKRGHLPAGQYQVKGSRGAAVMRACGTGKRKKKRGHALNRSAAGDGRQQGAAFKQIIGRAPKERPAKRRETLERLLVFATRKDAELGIGERHDVVVRGRREQFAREAGRVDEREDALGAVFVEAGDP